MFTPADNQEELYDELDGTILAALNGHNVCVLAYGQTTSGKSYTMLGSAGNAGMIMRACDRIFRQCQDDLLELQTQTAVHFSMMEVYNDEVFDMLVQEKHADKELYNPTSAVAPHRSLAVRHVRNTVSIEGLTEYDVSSCSEVAALLALSK